MGSQSREENVRLGQNLSGAEFELGVVEFSHMAIVLNYLKSRDVGRDISEKVLVGRVGEFQRLE